VSFLERDYCWTNFVGSVNFERIDGEPEVRGRSLNISVAKPPLMTNRDMACSMFLAPLSWLPRWGGHVWFVRYLLACWQLIDALAPRC
jgi:hypothetical protein